MPRIERQPIEEVFVDLLVREEVRNGDETDDGCGETGGSARPVRSQPRQRQPIDATECIGTHDRVIVLGNPGCGKTTLFRFVAHSYASRDEADRNVPILIRLPELCRAIELDERVDPVKFVAAHPGGLDVERFLREELASDKGRCLVLFDGLDEVGSQSQRERLIRCVREFIEQYPRNRFAITSRIVGFDSSPWRGDGFAVFRILGYGKKQLKSFAEKWAKILSHAENRPHQEILDTLKTAIFANPRVRALASNPLILTILVLLNEARGGTLPRRRVDLYERVVDVFLDTWESNKRSVDKFDDTYNIDLDAREFRWLLSDLSLAMQKAERTLAQRWWLAERMQEYLQNKLGFEPAEAKDACDRIIRYLAERTGLIEERGLDLFGFSHRTVQEYFASLGVVDEADASSSRSVTDCLRGYYFHPQWAEVVRLVAAQLTPPLAESLVSSILDDPDPVGRFLRRGPLLALRCLSDGTSVPNRRLVAGILDSLVDLGKSRWLGITFEAIDALESFEGTRLREQANQTVAAILDMARKELSDEDYGCLHEGAHVQQMFESAREQMPDSFASEAAREVAVEVGDRTCTVVVLNGQLLSEDPDKWYSSVCELLDDPNQSSQLKLSVVRELGRKIETDRRGRMRLRKILCSKEDDCVRAACAFALARATKGKHSTKRLLLQVLDRDHDQQVRRACAGALRDAAAEDASLANRLMRILESDESAEAQSGAARGLAKVALSQPLALELLQRVVSRAGKSGEVRVSCAWALEPQLGKDSATTRLFKAWLDAPDLPKLRRIAAQSLAMAVANERLAWDRSVVEKVEHILMNLETPCRHALDGLGKLATAREIHHGLRIEHVLAECLRSLAEHVELAFVFGSTARNRQTEESDIDLLIIGDVNLKGLSGPLCEAERTLGRRVNPAIYARKVFQEKYQAGDPFLLDVYRREKIPVVVSGGGTSQKELDDELRAMVAERVASAK
ncbi:MAG: NACHT domain-containing protein [Planctomycetota bacterium]